MCYVELCTGQGWEAKRKVNVFSALTTKRNRSREGMHNSNSSTLRHSFADYIARGWQQQVTLGVLIGCLGNRGHNNSVDIEYIERTLNFKFRI